MILPDGVFYSKQSGVGLDVHTGLFHTTVYPKAGKIVNLHFPWIYIFARIYIPNLRKLRGKCKFYIFPKNVVFRRKIEDFCKNENFQFFFAH